MRRNRLFPASIVVILILTLVPGNSQREVGHVDKIVHCCMFLVLSVNACYKFQKENRKTEALIWGIFFGLLTEVLQQFIPGRDMDIYDGIADTLGVIAGFYIYRFQQSKLDRIILKLGA